MKGDRPQIDFCVTFKLSGAELKKKKKVAGFEVALCLIAAWKLVNMLIRIQMSAACFTLHVNFVVPASLRATKNKS